MILLDTTTTHKPATPPAGRAVEPTGAPVLMAALIAARRAGDRKTAAAARLELEHAHGIKIGFAVEMKATSAGGGR